MKHFILSIVLAAAAFPAQAAQWNVDHDRSRLGFTVMWGKEPFSGTFKNWQADIVFDPGDLAHAQASVSVDLDSEISDEPDFDDGLKGAMGFQVSQFPRARFVATGFVRKSADSFVANGRLSLRGVTRDIVLPFTLTVDGPHAHMKGTAEVIRTEFGVGQGPWSAPVPVAHDVTVTIDLYATAK